MSIKQDLEDCRRTRAQLADTCIDLRKENEILREANQGQDAERIGVMNQRNQAWAEVERLRNRVTRLRKALNWMRGCFDPESWEYKRATVVLDEEAE